MLPQGARKAKQIQSIGKVKLFHDHPGPELGVLRFGIRILRVGTGHHGAVTSHPNGVHQSAVHPQFALAVDTLAFFSSFGNRLMKRLIEGIKHLGPIHLTLGDAVKIFFHFGREPKVHHHWKMLQQEIVDQHANIRRTKFVFVGAGNFFEGLPLQRSIRLLFQHKVLPFDTLQEVRST